MQDHQDLEAKVVRLEQSLESIKELMKELKSDVDDLFVATQHASTTMALLNQSLEQINKKNEDRKSISEKIGLFIVGGFIAAVISWIIRGGLGS